MTTFELFPLPETAKQALLQNATTEGLPAGMKVVGGLTQEDRELLTPDVLTFVRDLIRKERTFDKNLATLMKIRKEKQDMIYENIRNHRQAITFPPETRTIREEGWTAETIRPSNMNDRACENTHPSRAANMAIHGLNSAAASDFLDNEDSQAPLKANVLSGYHVIYAAVTGTINDGRPGSKTVLKGRIKWSDLTPFVGGGVSAENLHAELIELGYLNKYGRITDIFTEPNFVFDSVNKIPDAVNKAELEKFLRSRRPATIQVRVRGLHLQEAHVLVDDQPVSAALLDFAVFVSTCSGALREIHAQPTLYLPKMEGRFETEWWSKIFAVAAEMLAIDKKWIRSTTMIETITASMEKDEMNYTLREHSLGQNKGRYDYLFNFIKRLTVPKSEQVQLLAKAVEERDPTLVKEYKQFILPDNAYTTMGTSFLEAYSNHTSQVNLRRGFDSVGGMVTNIPTGDSTIDGKAKVKLRVDKTNEAWKGDAGGWSGHPAFSAAVREPFDIVRGIHKGFKVVEAAAGRGPLVIAIQASTPSEEGLKPLLELIEQARMTSGKKEEVILDNLIRSLKTSTTLHIAANVPAYLDGLVRFIDLEAPKPDVVDLQLIAVPDEQHAVEKFTYAGLLQYVRLALYYTASFIHGTGCIALDGVFEDLATAEKARCNVWQWLTLDQEITLRDGKVVPITTEIYKQAMDEVYDRAMNAERDIWGKVCKSVYPLQPDELSEKHFVVARKVLDILITNDRCVEFIPDLAYPFLLEPVRRDDKLWSDMVANLDSYRDPMDKYAAKLKELRDVVSRL